MKEGCLLTSLFFYGTMVHMIFDTIKNVARENGSKTALICKDKQYTYSELIESVEKLAAILSTAVHPVKVFYSQVKKNITM